MIKLALIVSIVLILKKIAKAIFYSGGRRASPLDFSDNDNRY